MHDEKGKPIRNKHALAIIRKIKAKKLNTLVLKIPKNSVLKIIAKLEEQFKIHNKSGDREMPEFAYNDFLQNFGLQNVADLKFRRFLKAVRVYSKQDPEIRSFAEQIKLIDVPKKEEPEAKNDILKELQKSNEDIKEQISE